MQIFGENPFSRQRISTSFFCLAANYADSAGHAQTADTAKLSLASNQAEHSLSADRANHAVLSDTAEFALGGSAVVSAQKADSAGKAGNAFALGGYPAGDFARKMDVAGIRVDSARISNKTDSLGSFPASAYAAASAIPGIKVNSAANADSLGNGAIALRNGAISVGTTQANMNLNVNGRIELNGNEVLGGYYSGTTNVQYSDGVWFDLIDCGTLGDGFFIFGVYFHSAGNGGNIWECRICFAGTSSRTSNNANTGIAISANIVAGAFNGRSVALQYFLPAGHIAPKIQMKVLGESISSATSLNWSAAKLFQ